MQFQCDRCGKRYSTGQEIREGRAYRFKCRACGHDVIVRGAQGLAEGGATPTPVVRRAGNGVQAGGLTQPVPRPLAETPPPTVAVVNPGDHGPPPGGYLEFRLDNDVVTTQTGITASLTDATSRELTPPPPSPFLAPTPAQQAPPQQATLYVPPPILEPPSGDPTPGLSGEARVEAKGPVPPSRRRLVVALVAVVPAVAVILLFGGLWESSSSGKTAGAAKPTAPAQTPGLLTPQVYVGPVTFEAPTPQVEPATAPARPAPRPAAAPPRPAPARREVATARKPAPAPARAAASRQPEPAEPEPPPPEPQVTQAAPIEPAPAPAPAAAPPPLPAPVPTPVPAQAAPAVAVPAPAPAPPASDDPVFAGPGFRRPVPEQAGCIERGIRIPQYLADRLPPAVLLRFAVGRDGHSDLVQVLPGAESGPGSRPVDPRLAESLTQAVRACRFVPGADEAGRPARLWVTMRVRFAE